MKKLISKLKNFGRKKTIIISAVVLIVIAAIITFANLGKKTVVTAELTPVRVERGDISVSISGSGTIEPISRYEIVSLVKGEILSSDFNEGDTVNEGDVLYRIDSTDASNNIQKQRNSVERMRLSAMTNNENIANLKVRAPASGTLTDFTLKENDMAREDKAATIVNSSTLVASIPFNSSQLSKINVGDSATVTSALYMTTLSGTVQYKSNAPIGTADGSTLYEVEISLDNPGSLSGGTSVGATVHTSGGDVKSPVSGTVENGETVSVIPKVSGKITKVYVKNGQYVNKGDILFQIDDTEYAIAQTRSSLELQDAVLSLETSEKELEKYNITSPINGVVISKTYKAGDTIGGSSNQDSGSVLMTVADTSRMVFNLDVDELEIAKVRVGLSADIDADALPNEKFRGIVTKVAKEGTSSNGVTTYKVELTIDEPGNLMSGMNVNAEIIAEQSKATLILPVTAVSNIRNNEGYALVKDNMPKADLQVKKEAEGTEGVGRGREGQRQPQASNGERTRSAFGSLAAPEGYRRVKVKTGLSNTDFVEIIDGLNEGDEVYFSAAAASSNTFGGSQRNVMVGGPGGMSGGMHTR